MPAGVALSSEGNELGSMGVAVGDYNASGRFSLFVTNFAEQEDSVYRNEPDHTFTDISFASKSEAKSVSCCPPVGIGGAGTLPCAPLEAALSRSLTQPRWNCT